MVLDRPDVSDDEVMSRPIGGLLDDARAVMILRQRGRGRADPVVVLDELGGLLERMELDPTLPPTGLVDAPGLWAVDQLGLTDRIVTRLSNTAGEILRRRHPELVADEAAGLEQIFETMRGRKWDTMTAEQLDAAAEVILAGVLNKPQVAIRQTLDYLTELVPCVLCLFGLACSMGDHLRDKPSQD